MILRASLVRSTCGAILCGGKQQRSAFRVAITSALTSSRLPTFSTLALRPDNETLFSYTSGRWVCNHEQQMKLRYSPFDVDALESIACRAAGAQRCLSWEKIGEGAFNKAFLLKFDSGAAVTIRIPCPIVANVEQTIASEVATMSYIRERWAEEVMHITPLPPKVIAWDKTSRNPAGTPYIITEFVPGVQLFSRWPFIQGDDAGIAIAGMIEMETCLLSEPFSQYGSLYFAEDLPEELRNRPLYAPDSVYEDVRRQRATAPRDYSRNKALRDALSTKYKIGPTVDREWWRGGYGRVAANRGPWPDLPSMIRSAAEFQLRAIDEVVDFSAPFIESKPSDEPLLRRMLRICIEIAPLIVPRNRALVMPVLGHPNLTLTDLIVQPEGPATCLAAIDWQCATVSPYCQQCNPAPAVLNTGPIPIPKDGSMPPWPEDFDQMPEDMQEVYRIYHRFACRSRWYALKSCELDPLRPEAWRLPQAVGLANLVTAMNRSVADGPFELRDHLLRLQQKWNSFAEGPCPIDFTSEEIAAHRAEKEMREEYAENVLRLCKEMQNPPHLPAGCVFHEDYEHAKEVMEQWRANWDEAAMKGPFPFYEGAHSYYLT